MKNLLYGLVLAGGKSSRMGQDKSALVYHDGKSQVIHLQELLRPYVQDVFISIRPEQAQEEHFEGCKFILDSCEERTPLNGILSAMKAYPKVSWLVVAVDMPKISKEAIELLVSSRKMSEVATAFPCYAKDGPDPLFAIWEGSSYNKIQEFISQKDKYCPRGVLKALGVHIIEDCISPEVLSNINTFEEYQNFVKQ